METTEQRTRFRYFVDERVSVRVTPEEGEEPEADGKVTVHGRIETRITDPTKKPYIVRYDVARGREGNKLINGFYNEDAISRVLTPTFTIVFEEGTGTAFERVQARLAEVSGIWVQQALDMEDIEARRERAAKMVENFHAMWAWLTMRPNAFDGPLHIAPWSYDGDNLSFGFRYEGSGFEGGLIFFPERIAGGKHSLLGEWSLHS